MKYEYTPVARTLAFILSLILISPPLQAQGIFVKGSSTYSGGTVTNPILFPDGTEAAPSIAWANDADGSGTGIYRNAANNMSFTLNGLTKIRLANNAAIGITIASDLPFCINSTTTTQTGSGDVCMFREAAGFLQFGPDTSGAPGLYTIKGADHITTADVGGANLTFASGTGMGTGTASSLIFQTPTVAAAGANPQSLATRLTLTANTQTFVGTVVSTNSGFLAAAGGSSGWSGRSLLSSPSDGVIELSNAAITDFTRLQFGGTTTSFPAHGRVATTITTTLGDGTAGGFLAHGYGGNAASATALAITGNISHVTGTTNITSITATNIQAGTVVTLIFDGILTFTDGNNLKLAGNFVTTADDSITLAYDGTNFYETARAVN